MDIFKHLNIHDLTAVAIAADWCKVLAKDSFTRHHRNTLDLQISAEDQFEQCLKVFGSSATSVSISRDQNTPAQIDMTVLEIVAKNCGKNVEALTLNGFSIDMRECTDNTTKFELCRLMCSLKSLSVCNGFLFNAELLFEFCDKTLETIKLEEMYISSKTMSSLLRMYPNLRTIVIIGSSRSIESAHIVKLLRMNPNIQRLKLCRSSCSSALLNIVCGLSELTSLTIRIQNNIQLDALAQIAKLQRLKLIGCKRWLLTTSLIEALAAKTTLTDLELCDMLVNQNLFQLLSQNEHLQILKLVRVECIEFLPYIAANFKTLLELHILDSQMTGLTISEGLLTRLITEMDSLRILNVQLLDSSAWHINYNVIDEICKQRTNQSSLLVFWANDFQCTTTRAISRDNISIVFPCDGVASRIFEYDVSDSEEDFAKTYERVQQIAQQKMAVRLKNSSLSN